MNQNKVDKLISNFALSADEHNKAILSGNSRKANVRAKRIKKIFSQIVDIGETARNALLEQTNNENDAIAAMAAVYSLKYDTEHSLVALRRISEKPGMVGFRAGQAIKRWEEGTWQLE